MKKRMKRKELNQMKEKQRVSLMKELKKTIVRRKKKEAYPHVKIERRKNKILQAVADQPLLIKRN